MEGESNIAEQNSRDVNTSSIEPVRAPPRACYCSFCCCGIRLIIATKIIIYYGIIAWICFAFVFVYTVSSTGGTNWVPGYGQKYLSISCFLGYSMEALGGLTTILSKYSKEFVLTRYTWLKICSLILTQITNIGKLISQPLYLDINKGSLISQIFGFILWAALDIYFILLLRSYGLEPKPNIPISEDNNRTNHIPYPIPPMYYQGGAAINPYFYPPVGRPVTPPGNSQVTQSNLTAPSCQPEDNAVSCKKNGCHVIDEDNPL
eukprot:TRINITY_DN4024_c0_g1_i6.p1 TRINITY_DN4024_c0_g1~~TRINITY_DN4024_c0_g1_i6.p1  ORF type:complete len:262 (-),score=34.09 TRINITY_DN4024_c0_g1_i6:149-934(-)